MMEIFESCSHVNDLLNGGEEIAARNELIKILDFCEQEEVSYSPLVNHLLRQSGLYPYIEPESALWEDRVICEVFKVDVGLPEPVLLHREQSRVLKKLMEGENLALSAPTSFGKSFIIDAFIALKQPTNVAIIVPTIALTDETRRRLTKKFSDKYKIITTTGVELSDRNIFVFPQERAIFYSDKIQNLDMLIIDEFYKAGADFDKERSPSLLRAILALGKLARQKYFLAPNISHLVKSPLFTDGVEFLELKFNTVYLEMNNLHTEINGDEKKKSEHLVRIVKEQTEKKTLIYAGTYSNITKIANLLVDNLPISASPLLDSFQKWLALNYSQSWTLTSLIKRGVGGHNGQLHRSLGQIQIKLFEESKGLDVMVSTSSIIEGVNTSAENVILWKNKKGRSRLDDFTYKNIIGRGGRMFRHFVGKIFVLEEPPESESNQLNLALPDQLLGAVHEESVKSRLSARDLARVKTYEQEMGNLVGPDIFSALQHENVLQTSDSTLHKDIATELRSNPAGWRSLAWLNSPDPGEWTSVLYKVINLQPGGWEGPWGKLVGFIKVLANNWNKSIPELLRELDDLDVGIDDFFKLERNVAFRLGALLNDLNILQKRLCPDNGVDISPFVNKASHAFLPPVVYQLEEYGLPRMISRKVQTAGLIDLVSPRATLHDTVKRLNGLGFERFVAAMPSLDEFDKYIVQYFFDGIGVQQTAAH